MAARLRNDTSTATARRADRGRSTCRRLRSRRAKAPQPRSSRPADSCRLLVARGALALDLREITLAKPDRLRRHLDELVVLDELDRGFQRELDRRRERHGF